MGMFVCVRVIVSLSLCLQLAEISSSHAHCILKVTDSFTDMSTSTRPSSSAEKPTESQKAAADTAMPVGGFAKLTVQYALDLIANMPIKLDTSSSAAKPTKYQEVVANTAHAGEPSSGIAKSTYEVNLLWYWAASRPVARISMATMADRRKCRGLRASWAIHCMTQLGRHDLASCRGCGQYPTDSTCSGCHIAWCDDCHAWSAMCWKCYRPRHELQDCGEFAPGHGGPGGNGRFE
jgi:hypothetical protein